MPDATASSTAYWMIGLSTSGSISFGIVLVAGRKRVPRPAAGNTAVRTVVMRLTLQGWVDDSTTAVLAVELSDDGRVGLLGICFLTGSAGGWTTCVTSFTQT